jgi:flagellar basal body-associated protein FliL
VHYLSYICDSRIIIIIIIIIIIMLSCMLLAGWRLTNVVNKQEFELNLYGCIQMQYERFTAYDKNIISDRRQ